MKAVFLDRDGVIVADKGYHYKLSDFELLSDVPKAIKKLNDSGYFVVIITNQSGIGRGYFTEEDFENFNNHLLAELKKSNAHVGAIYYCPHHPTDGIGRYRKNCDCRKPGFGMFLQAAKEHSIDLSDSWMVGDNISDMIAGNSAGCRCIFIGSTKPVEAESCARNLNEAVDYILSR